MNDAPVLPDEDDEVGELLNDKDYNGVDEDGDDDAALVTVPVFPDEDDEVGEKHFCQVGESGGNCKDNSADTNEWSLVRMLCQC